MEPLWAILIVNLVALFIVPFFTYWYNHKNNLKILKEKWICELRDTAIEYFNASENLYYANDNFYRRTSTPVTVMPDVQDELQRRREEAQGLVTATSAKIKLLFKKNDSSYVELSKKIDDVLRFVDNPTTEGNLKYIDIDKKNIAQNDYLEQVNQLLHRCWDEISK